MNFNNQSDSSIKDSSQYHKQFLMHCYQKRGPRKGIGSFNCKLPFMGSLYRSYTSMMFCNVIKTLTTQKIIKINQIGITIYGQHASFSKIKLFGTF